jgi:hypothetical protein
MPFETGYGNSCRTKRILKVVISFSNALYANLISVRAGDPAVAEETFLHVDASTKRTSLLLHLPDLRVNFFLYFSQSRLPAFLKKSHHVSSGPAAQGIAGRAFRKFTP